jgi:endonuclease YncB( thermonuclease family)
MGLVWLGATVSLLTFGGGMLLTTEWRGSGEAVAASSSFPCTVSSITDGDTFRCARGRSERDDQTRIRLSGVAARETDGTCQRGHPCPERLGGSCRG